MDKLTAKKLIFRCGRDLFRLRITEHGVSRIKGERGARWNHKVFDAMKELAVKISETPALAPLMKNTHETLGVNFVELQMGVFFWVLEVKSQVPTKEKIAKDICIKTVLAFDEEETHKKFIIKGQTGTIAPDTTYVAVYPNGKVVQNDTLFFEWAEEYREAP